MEEHSATNAREYERMLGTGPRGKLLSFVYDVAGLIDEGKAPPIFKKGPNGYELDIKSKRLAVRDPQNGTRRAQNGRPICPEWKPDEPRVEPDEPRSHPDAPCWGLKESASPPAVPQATRRSAPPPGVRPPGRRSTARPPRTRAATSQPYCSRRRRTRPTARWSSSRWR